MVGVLVVAVLLIGVAAGGMVAYRRILGSGSYEGTMPGAISAGAILGAFLGFSIGLATLLLVLLLRAVR